MDDMNHQTTKLMKQMLQLFNQYIQDPYNSDGMHNLDGLEYNMILDVIKHDQGRLMSIFLENFIRLLGTNVEKQAASGKWIDRLDKRVKSKQLIWKQEKYIAACQALYNGINQYVTNMASEYQQQHLNMDEKYKENFFWMKFRVDINAELFKDVLSTQRAMADKCRQIHLHKNKSLDYFSMDKYIVALLMFMLFFVVLMIRNSINFEWKQQNTKAIEYEASIKDICNPTQSESSPYIFPPTNNFLFYNNVNFGNNSRFNQQLPAIKGNLLSLECNNYNYDNYQLESDWLWHDNSLESFESLELLEAVYRPLNTDKELAPIFRTLIDYSVPTDQSLWTNLTANNQFYDLWMNPQCIDMVKHVIDNDLPHSLFITNYFHSSYHPKDIKVSKGAKRLMEDPNAGGCSELSESFSYEILKQCFGAKLLKTEMEIKYQYKNCKITDYLASFNEKKIGVSVTRAYSYIGEFDEHQSSRLLNKKIYGVNESTKNVCEQDSFSRQILHIWTTDENITNPREKDILFQTFKQLLLTNPKFIDNTIFIVTITSPDCWWIYRQNKLLGLKCSKKKANDNAISV